MSKFSDFPYFLLNEFIGNIGLSTSINEYNTCNGARLVGQDTSIVSYSPRSSVELYIKNNQSYINDDLLSCKKYIPISLSYINVIDENILLYQIHIYKSMKSGDLLILDNITDNMSTGILGPIPYSTIGPSGSYVPTGFDYTGYETSLPPDYSYYDHVSPILTDISDSGRDLNGVILSSTTDAFGTITNIIQYPNGATVNNTVYPYNTTISSVIYPSGVLGPYYAVETTAPYPSGTYILTTGSYELGPIEINNRIIYDHIRINYNYSTSTKDYYEESLHILDDGNTEIYFRKDSDFFKWLLSTAPGYCKNKYGIDFDIRRYVNLDSQFIYFGTISQVGTTNLYTIEYRGIKDYVNECLPFNNLTPKLKEFLDIYFDKQYYSNYFMLKNIWSMIDPNECNDDWLYYIGKYYNYKYINKNFFNSRDFLSKIMYYLKRKGTYDCITSLFQILSRRNNDRVNIIEYWYKDDELNDGYIPNGTDYDPQPIRFLHTSAYRSLIAATEYDVHWNSINATWNDFIVKWGQLSNLGIVWPSGVEEDPNTTTIVSDTLKYVQPQLPRTGMGAKWYRDNYQQYVYPEFDYTFNKFKCNGYTTNTTNYVIKSTKYLVQSDITNNPIGDDDILPSYFTQAFINSCKDIRPINAVDSYETVLTVLTHVDAITTPYTNQFDNIMNPVRSTKQITSIGYNTHNNMYKTFDIKHECNTLYPYVNVIGYEDFSINVIDENILRVNILNTKQTVGTKMTIVVDVSKGELIENNVEEAFISSKFISNEDYADINKMYTIGYINTFNGYHRKALDRTSGYLYGNYNVIYNDTVSNVTPIVSNIVDKVSQVLYTDISVPGMSYVVYEINIDPRKIVGINNEIILEEVYIYNVDAETGQTLDKCKFILKCGYISIPYDCPLKLLIKVFNNLEDLNLYKTSN